MNSIVPSQAIEHSNQRILTTEQVADAYGTTPKILLRNFQRNKSKFTEGKHYFVLEGDTLQNFTIAHVNLTCAKLVENSEEQHESLIRLIQNHQEEVTYFL